MTPTIAPSAVPTAAPPKRYYLAQAAFRKFTLAEYHKLIELGVFMDGEPYELLEGNLVHKMSRGTPHDTTLDLLEEVLARCLPQPWYPRTQKALTLADSEPEPDIAIVPGPRRRYSNGHPTPAEARLLIEVSASSLLVDRHDKGSIYAGAGVPVYWVVNVADKVIEVYTQPGGTGEAAAYAACDVFPVGASVPVVLDGATVGTVAVADVMG
ncbi:Uma2 family endonuclease [Gemmata sp.]|uniref:Uma2 family endonuclease n=1 Tax=Gemmata sp. TaxID=1914242 RepID=UPI003F7174D4